MQMDPVKAMQLQQAKQLFGRLYRTNPNAAFAIAAGSGTGYHSALDGWIIQNFFGNDTTAYKNWLQENQYGEGKNWKYDANTGAVTNSYTNQTLNQGYSGPYTQYFATTGGLPAPGMNKGGQPGTTAPNPYAGMTTLYRDNTGMIHDPGDNPIPTQPPTPGMYPTPGYGQMPWTGQGGQTNNHVSQYGYRNPNKRPPGFVAPPTTPPPMSTGGSQAGTLPGGARNARPNLPFPGTTPPVTTPPVGAPPNSPVQNGPRPWDNQNTFNNYSPQ